MKRTDLIRHAICNIPNVGYEPPTHTSELPTSQSEKQALKHRKEKYLLTRYILLVCVTVISTDASVLKVCSFWLLLANFSSWLAQGLNFARDVDNTEFKTWRQ